MKDTAAPKDPWENDDLGYSAYGDTFTNLIKSISDSKVISIEAGFGRGKTFFRHAWAEQLRASGELVIEIDAQQSDHSGDPIITFMGALLSAQTASGKTISATVKSTALKLAGVASRSVMKAVLRSGADEIIEHVSEWAQDQVPENQSFDRVIGELEASLSKAAGNMLVTHLAAERAREKEFPEQIDALRDALTEGASSDRIIILIDELDRCHPEYAIALLESMKLVFGRKGFVFCLMVNPHYLESIATHRFGASEYDELYLEKFVDLRLALKPTTESLGLATEELIKKIEVKIPFGTSEAFSTSTAAVLANSIVQRTHLSFRQIKRIAERIDLATRCYGGKAIDLPLLVFLAFSEATKQERKGNDLYDDLLPRSRLTPEISREMLNISNSYSPHYIQDTPNEISDFINHNCLELSNLEPEIYGLDPDNEGRKYFTWFNIFSGLGPNYLPSHKAMLDGVLKIMA